MARRLENQRKKPAFFLLAMLQQAGGIIRLGIGCLEVGPPELARKLTPKIQEHKANLVRLLLAQDCPVCGFSTERRTWYTPALKTWHEAAVCVNHGRFNERIVPDFPVLDKNGREI